MSALSQAFGVGLAPGLGLDDRELGVAVDENVVGDLGLGARTVAAAALQATQRDPVLAQNPAAVDHTPASGFERRVDVFGAGLGFVHHAVVS